jgi:hypothetical protein
MFTWLGLDDTFLKKVQNLKTVILQNNFHATGKKIAILRF